MLCPSAWVAGRSRAIWRRWWMRRELSDDLSVLFLVGKVGGPFLREVPLTIGKEGRQSLSREDANPITCLFHRIFWTLVLDLVSIAHPHGPSCNYRVCLESTRAFAVSKASKTPSIAIKHPRLPSPHPHSQSLRDHQGNPTRVCNKPKHKAWEPNMVQARGSSGSLQLQNSRSLQFYGEPYRRGTMERRCHLQCRLVCVLLLPQTHIRAIENCFEVSLALGEILSACITSDNPPLDPDGEARTPVASQ